MTLLPSDEFGITGWPGNQYAVNDVCAHPSCGKASAHAHHMWARSFIRKNYDWVRLPDGTILGNRIGLCQGHHDMVTGEIGGYRARLIWEAGIMWWADRTTEASRVIPNGAKVHFFLTEQKEMGTVTTWTTLAPLSTQPPVSLQINATEADAMRVTSPSAHGHVDGEVCPTCGHHKKDPDAPRAKLPRRNTKEWTITVPDDAELGADIIDGMIEDFAIPLGATEWSSRLKRYHVLIAVLAWATANREQFISDIASAAERRLAG